MKKIVLIIILLFGLGHLHAANVPTVTVENIKTSEAIQIIEVVAKEMNYPLGQFDKKNKVLITKYIEWTSITVLNHAKLKFEASNGQVVITMIERQYKSTEGWTNSLTNLSKKNIKKYLGGFGNKMTAIANSDELRKQAMQNSVLIKLFRPIIEQDGVRLKFVKGTKNMVAENFRMPNIVIEIEITNMMDDTIKMLNAGADHGVGSFSEPKPEVRFRIYTLILAPGESGKLFLYIRKDESLIDELNFSFGLIYKKMASVNVKVSNYNVIIPFENKFE